MRISADTFDPDDWAILAQHWYSVALSREIGDAPVSVRLRDEPLVVFPAYGQAVQRHLLTR